MKTSASIAALAMTLGFFSNVALAQTPNVHIENSPNVAMMTWFMSYISLAGKGNYIPHSRISPPLLWLYNPAGKAIAFFTKDNPSKMKATFTHFFGSVGKAKLLPLEPDLAVMLKLLNNVGVKEPQSVPGGKYTAVLYIKNGRCDLCMRFLSEVQDVARHYPQKLRIITITLIKPKHTVSKPLPPTSSSR